LRFETTDWSLILQATADSSAVARGALARLLETYWPPVYAFIRRKGHSAADAEDLTQAYFARFFEKDYLNDFRPEAGRFRTFLRASVSHFLANVDAEIRWMLETVRGGP
jgi:RNA polymerase sigma factor (sigma-70 family)